MALIRHLAGPIRSCILAGAHGKVAQGKELARFVTMYEAENGRSRFADLVRAAGVYFAGTSMAGRRYYTAGELVTEASARRPNCLGRFSRFLRRFTTKT
jgi:hypothetical protein